MPRIVRVLNYSGFPISRDVKRKIEEKIGDQAVAGQRIRVVDIDNTHLDYHKDMVQHAMNLVEQAHLGTAEQAYIIVPGFSVLAAHLLAVIHGATGRFPLVIWLSKDAAGAFTEPHYTQLDTLREDVHKSTHANH